MAALTENHIKLIKHKTKITDSYAREKKFMCRLKSKFRDLLTPIFHAYVKLRYLIPPNSEIVIVLLALSVIRLLKKSLECN